MKRDMCYKFACFIALLFVSLNICAARDYFITLLTKKARRTAPGYYNLHEDFDSSIKEIKDKFEESPLIKSDYLVNEKGFKVYVFYNHRKTPRWNKLYVVLSDARVTARFY